MSETEEQPSGDVKEKVIGLVEYIKALVQVRSVVVRDCQEYVASLWAHEIPQENGCFCLGWPQFKNSEDGIWLEVHKQVLPKIPAIPDKCASWANLEAIRNPNEIPALNETILNPEWTDTEKNSNDSDGYELVIAEEKKVEQYLKLSDFPEVISNWDEYVNKSWVLWADDYKKKKRVQDIYSRLFSIYQQQKALGEAYEVIFGFGLLTWRTPKGESVFRHIVSTQIEMEFDPNKGAISVKPGAEGAIPQFEQDMLDPDDQPMLSVLLQLQESLKKIEQDVWNEPSFHPILRSWVQALRANGVFSEDWIPKREADKDPKVFFAPALILRKRTTRGFIRFADQILDQIKQAPEKISKALRIFVDVERTPAATKREEVFGQKDIENEPVTVNVEKAQEAAHIYFPLPANEEQKEIIHKLNKHTGVLVQGPPGTGKSHTIANLICHLLAQGKKVLITSQTPRALKVLMGKLPPKIRPLCVNLLGQGLKDLQSMESSVGEINRKFNVWNRETSTNEIKALEGSLEQCRRKIQEINTLMRELRESETRKYQIVEGRYGGTAQQIAEKIAQEEEKLGWIQDEVSMDGQPNLTPENLKNCLYLKRSLTDEICSTLKLNRPDFSKIPDAENFVQLVHQEKTSTKKAEEVKGNSEIFEWVSLFKQQPKEKRDLVIKALKNFKVAKQNALRRPLPWLDEAVRQILGEQDQPFKELEKVTDYQLQGLKEKARLVEELTINWPTETDLAKLKADAEDLCTHLKAGKSLGWGVFRSKKIKRLLYITKTVTVDGRPCMKSEQLEHLIIALGVEQKLMRLDDAWQGKIDKPQGTQYHRTAVYAEQLEALIVALQLEKNMEEVLAIWRQMEGFSYPKFHDEDGLNLALKALEGIMALDELRIAQDAFLELEKIIKRSASVTEHHSLNEELLKALETRDWRLWGQAFHTLQELEARAKEKQVLKELEDAFLTNLPQTFDEFKIGFKETCWDKRFNDFEDAWCWARAEAWLTNYMDSHDEYELQQGYMYNRKLLAELEANLAAEKAWAHCYERLTEWQRQHLMAWSVAIKRIGKGTGKYADRYRREAEGHLKECQSAIPAWIMPLFRVVDTVKPEPGMFDVVIIDEASQCGPEALLLQYISKQCIVVGDSEQIAPDAVGVSRGQVHILIEQFLRDVPIKDSFVPESSLFTHAEIRFKNKIVLKEHFRCVPEIIQFSNDLCYAPYGASLIPLRQYPPQRLEPIKEVYVRDGYREGDGQNVVNKPEAEALVNAIVECVKDARYKQKTMGVISLQGHLQAKFIEQRLIETIGPEEIEKRALVCGTPYDFQGDERNIMFISMVAATNERIGPFTKDADKRRFNVAASRAADQAWLFHSVALEELSLSDYRQRLLAYYLNPHREQETIDEQIFESKFQKEVYEKITGRGFRVVPEYKVANYRIDLVVEGLQGRLAVECDGDTWHGPDAYEKDTARQRILERAGWTFWRIRGSAYYRDAEQALEPLWQKLKELGIGSKYERYEEKQKTQQDKQESYEEKPSPDGHYDQEQRVEEPQEERLPIEAVKRMEKALFDDDSLRKAPEVTDAELTLFCTDSNNEKKLPLGMVRAMILKVLSEETSKGKDLLPDEVIKRLGYTCRRTARKKLEKKVQRVLADLLRESLVEEYHTEKRKRIRLKNRTEILPTEER
ncbi:MAG: AAA domain-containing protein [Candidatus Omnitrophica bacterium]|nr:AAA domain-containing protein [Candidatus Omnitrophota bacterium]